MLGDPSDNRAVRPTRGVSRRALLGSAIAGGLVAGLPGVGLAAQNVAVPGVKIDPVAKPVRNVILLIVDGMSAGTLSLAEHYSRIVLGKRTNWMTLGARAGSRRALCTNHSLDSAVTDSAAASSALSTGLKYRNGALCVLPDGLTPTPWLMRLKEQNPSRAVGCVTTTTITHATPGGFYCNVTDRGDQKDVGQQLVQRDIDLALGGGRQYVPDAPEGSGINRIQTRAELKAWAESDHTSRAKRLIGTFNDSHISMSLERRDDEPSLLEMTRAAVEHLSLAPDGFFLQVEAGRVDHAAHANDAGGLLTDMLEADTVLGYLSEFADGRDDTLIIATTDHGTGGPANTFYGRHGVECFKKLTKASKSFEWVMEKFAALPSTGKDGKPTKPEQQAAELVRLLGQATGLEFGNDARKILTRKFAGEQVDPSMRRNEIVSVMGSLVGNGFGIQWISPDHTGESVEVLAFGAHADTLPAGMDNTDMPGWIARGMGVAW